MLLLRGVYISGRWMRLINFRNVLISKYKGTDVYGRRARRVWKEDKGRLAFEDRFQYHEWTFKQACISSLLRSLAGSSATSLLSSPPPPYALRLSLRRPWLGCFPFRPSIRIFSSSPTAWENCRPKLCAILNILINRTQHVRRTSKNKFCLPDDIWLVV